MIYFVLIVVALAVGAVAWVIFAYNGLVGLRKRLDEAWSGILVQLKRRHDLVPNLVETVKSYASHESGLLERIAAARSPAKGLAADQVAASEGEFGRSLVQLFAVVENYPELKANKNYSDLHDSLFRLEDEIQMARRYYNGVARDYNTMVSTFPTLLVARRFGFDERPYFELESAADAAAPAVGEIAN